MSVAVQAEQGPGHHRHRLLLVDEREQQWPPDLGRASTACCSVKTIRSAASPPARPTPSSNGQQVFAQIRNPVIVNETSIYGYPLKVLKSADIVFPAGTTPQYVGNSEGFYRDGANATSSFLDLDAKYRVNSDLTVKGLASDHPRRRQDRARPGPDVRPLRHRHFVRPERPERCARFAVHRRRHQHARPESGRQRLQAGRLRRLRHQDRRPRAAACSSTPSTSSTRASCSRSNRACVTPTTSAPAAATIRRCAAALPAAPTTGVMPYPADFGSGLGGGNWDNTGFTYAPEDAEGLHRGHHQDHHAGIRTPRRHRNRHARAPERRLRDGQHGSATSGRATSACASCAPKSTRRFPRRSRPTPASAPSRASRPSPCAAYPTAITTAGDGATYLDGVAFNPNGGVLYYKTPTNRTFNNLLPSLNLRYELRQGHDRAFRRQPHHRPPELQRARHRLRHAKLQRQRLHASPVRTRTCSR